MSASHPDFMRLIALGDTHCGSVSGLTPTNYELVPDVGSRQYELYELRRWLWANFVKELDAWGPFDLAIWNGDLIDGNQSKSSGWELLENDRVNQAEMAKAVVRRVGAKSNKFVKGTAYHTGPEEDFEALVANQFDEEILKEQVIDVNGTVIHATHHVGGGSLAHTRQNALGREITDILIRIAKRRIDAEEVHILLRSHAHFGGGLNDHGIEARRVPSLQLANDQKWARKLGSGTLDYGVLVIDVYGPGVFNVHPLLWELPPKMATKLDSGLIDSASEEMREEAVELLLKNPPEAVPVPQGYVGAN